MENVELSFLFNGDKINIQCEKNENILNILKKYAKMIEKDINNIFFLFHGDMINEEFKLDSIIEEEKTIQILVYEFEDNENNKMNLKQSQNIICPICKDICLIKFNDYKITFYNCNNKHSFSNILLTEFHHFQEIDESKIICHNCKTSKMDTHNNEFFKCNNCNFNLCPLCKSSHSKNHIIIDYDIKNNLCNEHDERYIVYCDKCLKNFCD